MSNKANAQDWHITQRQEKENAMYLEREGIKLFYVAEKFEGLPHTEAFRQVGLHSIADKIQQAKSILQDAYNLYEQYKGDE